MAGMFSSQPYVVGADLRNEPTSSLYRCGGSGGCSSTWGGGDRRTDWHSAVQRAGDKILAADPNLLIVVEGVDSSLDLTGVARLPVRLYASGLPVQDKLVYSPHSYPWDTFDSPSSCVFLFFDCHVPQYDQLSGQHLDQALGQAWGYILKTAPVWVGEFGVAASNVVSGAPCPTADESSANDTGWFACFSTYLQNADIDWSYWAVNGTQADGGGSAASQAFFTQETYGVLNPSWSQENSALTAGLQNLICPTQGPGATC
jgi:endoglucanase